MFWWITITAVFAGALLAVGLGWVLRRRWLMPVRMLSSAAAKMAGGQWDYRVQPHGAGALRELSSQLNALADRARQQLADLDTQRSDLRALVDSLPDAILLTDASRRIVLINAPAGRLLGVAVADAPGKPLVQVVNDEAVLVLFESLQQQPGHMQQRELRLARGGQRLVFHAVATRTKTGGMLLVLRNINAMAAAVQMKTDFVANASHELRTPIAAIKIAFETLQDVFTEDPQQSARCINVIDGHLRRLEEMLSDLLDLSRVEGAEIKPNLAAIRAADLFRILRQTMGPMARQKSVELILGGENGESIEFESDKRLLDLILRNLVENSIKYTPGGGKVMVNLRSSESSDGRGGRRDVIVLRVQDTGIGIPPEHLERVFERFYQVDSARSGSAGRGTGLGLAIVKHATSALGGEVDLQSAVGVGTTVTCTIPVRQPALVAAAPLEPYNSPR
jgi:two-component system phosphate regulon sensor histidine kinase PhoR